MKLIYQLKVRPAIYVPAALLTPLAVFGLPCFLGDMTLQQLAHPAVHAVRLMIGGGTMAILAAVVSRVLYLRLKPIVGFVASRCKRKEICPLDAAAYSSVTQVPLAASARPAVEPSRRARELTKA